MTIYKYPAPAFATKIKVQPYDDSQYYGKGAKNKASVEAAKVEVEAAKVEVEEPKTEVKFDGRTSKAKLLSLAEELGLQVPENASKAEVLQILKSA
jgi:hypothetical protein